MIKKVILTAFMASFAFASTALATENINASGIYKAKCKMCHKLDRKKIGPSFKSMHSDPVFLKEFIISGKKMMPSFKNKLSDDEVNAMVSFIKEQQPKADDSVELKVDEEADEKVKEEDCGCSVKSELKPKDMSF